MLESTHQVLVYAADVNILGGNVHTLKKNAEALVVASKETGLEENAVLCLNIIEEIRIKDEVTV